MEENKPTVAVDGATGYLGSHLVAALRQAGVPVRCIVHRGARDSDVQFLQSTGASIHKADLSSSDSELKSALSSCQVVVHLIGSIAPKKGERLEDLHGGQTASLIEAAKQAGVRKIVQVTALGTSGNAISSYHTTKWQAEEHVRNSGLRYVILRPSLILGRQVGQRNSKLIARYLKLIAEDRKVPVIGGGMNKLQPVFIGDLVSALQQTVISDQFDNNVYEIGGGEVLTMKELLQKLMTIKGTHKPIKAVPPFAANLMAMVCETMQDVPLVSRDQVKLACHDNICKNNALQQVFGVQPTTMDEALRTYAESPRPHAAAL